MLAYRATYELLHCQRSRLQRGSRRCEVTYVGISHHGASFRAVILRFSLTSQFAHSWRICEQRSTFRTRVPVREAPGNGFSVVACSRNLARKLDRERSREGQRMGPIGKMTFGSELGFLDDESVRDDRPTCLYAGILAEPPTEFSRKPHAGVYGNSRPVRNWWDDCRVRSPPSSRVMWNSRHAS